MVNSWVEFWKIPISSPYMDKKKIKIKTFIYQKKLITYLFLKNIYIFISDYQFFFLSFIVL